MRAGHLQAAVGVEVMDRKIEHRRRAAADPEHVDAAGAQAFGQRLGEFGRAQPAIEAEAGLAAARSGQQRRIGLAERPRVDREQRLADDAADVVFPQHRRVELVPGQALDRGADRTHALFLCCWSTAGFGTGRPMLV